MLQKIGEGWGSFRIVPVESGRGCPYGCEFCTVTGFFGDSIRFRTNESVVNELLLLKARAREEKGQIAVFFIDDNFAINIKRTKSLLRDIIAAGAQVHWVAQISANLLRDEELVDLIAASGGKWVFIGMESIDPANLKDVNKGFNKPGEYAAVLERLASRNVYAITSFIFGMDNDTVGAAERTLEQVRTWPPGLPIFGLLTPLPATPLYKRLEKAGRLTRPKHWQEFIPFAMAHTPLKMTIEEAHAEVNHGWNEAYSAKALAAAVDSLSDQPLGYRVNIFIARICFRGIYFPMMGKMAWVKVIAQNRKTIFKLVREGFQAELHGARAIRRAIPVSAMPKVEAQSKRASHRQRRLEKSATLHCKSFTSPIALRPRKAAARWLAPVPVRSILARIVGSDTLRCAQGARDFMAYVIAEPCIGTKDTACVDCLPGGLHSSQEGLRQVSAQKRCCTSIRWSALTAAPACPCVPFRPFSPSTICRKMEGVYGAEREVLREIA